MKKIVILFECILLISSYEKSTFDCCFLLNFPASFCEILCNDPTDNVSEFPRSPQSFAYAIPPLAIRQPYQINPLPKFIPSTYETQQLFPQIPNNYVYQTLTEIQQEVLPAQEPILPVQTQSSKNTTTHKKSQPKFAQTINMKDEEVADLLDAIEEFQIQTAQIHERIKPIPISSLIITDDSDCNNSKLKIIMLENIGGDLNTSKKLIQLAAEAQFGGQFNVICSNSDFSFLTNTELFCQVTKDDVSCYAYRLLL